VDSLTLGNKLLKNQVLRFVLSAGVGFLVDISAFYLFYHNLLIQTTYHVLFFYGTQLYPFIFYIVFPGRFGKFFDHQVFCIYRIHVFPG